MSAPSAPVTVTQWRLCIVLFLELVALLHLPRVAVWHGVTREIWMVFIHGCGATVCVALLLPVLVRGSGMQRMGALLLALFPLLLLYWVAVETIRLVGNQ